MRLSNIEQTLASYFSLQQYRDITSSHHTDHACLQLAGIVTIRPVFRAQDWQVHNTVYRPSLFQTLTNPNTQNNDIHGNFVLQTLHLLPYSRMLTCGERLVSFLMWARKTKVQQFACCSTNYTFNTWPMTDAPPHFPH